MRTRSRPGALAPSGSHPRRPRPGKRPGSPFHRTRPDLPAPLPDRPRCPIRESVQGRDSSVHAVRIPVPLHPIQGRPSTFDSVRRRRYIASMNKSAALVLSALALALAGAGCESEAQKAANVATAAANAKYDTALDTAYAKYEAADAAAWAKLEAALDTAHAKYDTAKKAAEAARDTALRNP